MAALEVVGDVVVWRAGAHPEQKVSPSGCPTHLLLLDHPLADDLVDGGLNESARDGVALPISFTVVWDPRVIGPNVAALENLEAPSPRLVHFLGRADRLFLRLGSRRARRRAARARSVRGRSVRAEDSAGLGLRRSPGRWPKNQSGPQELDEPLRAGRCAVTRLRWSHLTVGMLISTKGMLAVASQRGSWVFGCTVTRRSSARSALRFSAYGMSSTAPRSSTSHACTSSTRRCASSQPCRRSRTRVRSSWSCRR